MAKAVSCPCGETIKADTDDELVRLVQAHGLDGGLHGKIGLSRGAADALASCAESLPRIRLRPTGMGASRW